LSKHLSISNEAYLIAEVGLAHDGSLGAAYSFVDAAAETGVNAIKFQTHIPEEESSAFEQFRVNVFPQDKTRPEYWQRTAFTKEQWLKLADHTRSKGLDFLSSPFSELAVDWLEECGVAAWKIASGEVTNYPMLRKMARTQKPILLSTGMSDWSEIDSTIEFLKSHDAEIGLFQCTTSYPCPPEKWGLNIVSSMLEKYDFPIGLSDHSGTIVPSLSAATLGATLFEFHVVFHKDQFGPDTKASLTFEQTRRLVTGIRNLEIARENPIDKDQQAASLLETKKLFAKSLYAARDISANAPIATEDVAIQKPWIGIPASDFDQTIGRMTSADIKKGAPIRAEDLK